MPTVLDFLSKVNPTIIDEWDGKSYSNTKSNKGIYDNVIFNDICNNTIQECESDFRVDRSASP